MPDYSQLGDPSRDVSWVRTPKYSGEFESVSASVLKICTAQQLVLDNHDGISSSDVHPNPDTILYLIDFLLILLRTGVIEEGSELLNNAISCFTKELPFVSNVLDLGRHTATAINLISSDTLLPGPDASFESAGGSSIAADSAALPSSDLPSPISATSRQTLSGLYHSLGEAVTTPGSVLTGASLLEKPPELTPHDLACHCHITVTQVTELQRNPLAILCQDPCTRFPGSFALQVTPSLGAEIPPDLIADLKRIADDTSIKISKGISNLTNTCEIIQLIDLRELYFTYTAADYIQESYLRPINRINQGTQYIVDLNKKALLDNIYVVLRSMSGLKMSGLDMQTINPMQVDNVEDAKAYLRSRKAVFEDLLKSRQSYAAEAIQNLPQTFSNVKSAMEPDRYPAPDLESSHDALSNLEPNIQSKLLTAEDVSIIEAKTLLINFLLHVELLKTAKDKIAGLEVIVLLKAAVDWAKNQGQHDVLAKLSVILNSIDKTSQSEPITKVGLDTLRNFYDSDEKELKLQLFLATQAQDDPRPSYCCLFGKNPYTTATIATVVILVLAAVAFLHFCPQLTDAGNKTQYCPLS